MGITSAAPLPRYATLIRSIEPPDDTHEDSRQDTARLAAAGFRVSVLSSQRLLTPHQRRRYRINRNYLFFCRRTANPAAP